MREKIYKCDECGEPCILIIIEGDSKIPKTCPYSLITNTLANFKPQTWDDTV